MRYNAAMAEYFKSFAPAAPSKRAIAPAPFVTISRQSGAGGRELAETLLSRLSKEKGAAFSGWRVFDKSLCEQVAADPEVRVSLESLVNEEFHEGLDDYLRTVFADESSQTKVDHHVFRTIRSICSLGKAIVLGRGAALVTRDLSRGVRVRLVSARDARVKRIVRETRASPAEARKSLDLKDSRRARMVRAHFGKDIDDPQLYDCVWNADTVSLAEIAESLISLIRMRASS